MILSSGLPVNFDQKQTSKKLINFKVICYCIVVSKILHKEKMGKTLLKMLLAGALALTTPKFADAQIAEKINPFRQPAKTSLFYGSGDVNKDGKVDNSDYAAMASNPSIDEADLDGNGIPSTANDKSLLEQHLQAGATLPSSWEKLDSTQRNSWFAKMASIDKTDTITYRPGFISGNFATQANLNCYGADGFEFNEADTTLKYDLTNLQRFNIPLYYTTVSSGHGMNAILIGNNPLEFNNWIFFEPQTDGIVKPGSQSIPSNSSVKIKKLKWISNSSREESIFLTFNITNNQPSLASYDTARLVLERNFAPENFSLISPEDGASIDSCNDPVTFVWSRSFDRDANDSVKYDWVVKNKDTGIKTMLPETKDTSLTLSPRTLAKGNYEWFVSSTDGKETAFSDTLDFTIKNTPPTALAFTSPANNDTIKYEAGKLIIKYAGDADADNDNLGHLVKLSGPGIDTTFFTSDTSISLDASMLKPGSKYSLEGKVFDNEDTTDFAGKVEFYTPKTTSVSKVEESRIPEKSSLAQNFPNPFNPATRIKYTLKNSGEVSLKVYDVLGREVETLVDRELPAGEYEAEFNGSKYSSGVYFCRLQAKDFSETKKMVLGK